MATTIPLQKYFTSGTVETYFVLHIGQHLLARRVQQCTAANKRQPAVKYNTESQGHQPSTP